MKGNSMSKLIRSTTPVHRPAAKVGKRPVWIIASGGEIFILKRRKGAFTWAPANEADFGVKPALAANDALFNNLGNT
jgi:hypothetical protein